MRATISSRLAVGTLGLGLAAPALATNVLVVVIDDLGTDKLASYLSAEEEAQAAYLPATPNLDAVAAAGVRFTHAWASPVCSPSRASFLTGDHASTHGVGDTVGPDSTNPELADGVTLATELRAAGYATAAFGKWHLGYTGVGGTTTWDPTTTCPALTPVADELNPLRHGFDRYAGELSLTGASYLHWWKGDSPGDGTTGTCVEYTWHDDVLVADALDWVGDRWDAASGTMEPYFAYVAFKATHSDGEGGGRVHEENDIPPSVLVDDPCLEDGVRDSCGDADGDGEDDEERMIFQLLVEGTDAAVGALLEGIDALGEGALDDTLVVVWGDNGTTREIMEPPFLDSAEYGKGTVYETGIRVPLLVADAATWKARREGRLPSPGLVTRPGREVGRPVIVADLYDTILDTVGVAPSRATDGQSLAACLTTTSPSCGGALTRPTWVEQFRYGGGGLRAAQGAWRGSTLKVQVEYERASDCISPSVYDLVADPYELTDLYAGLPPARARSLKRSVEAVDAGWFPRDDADQIAWCR